MITRGLSVKDFVSKIDFWNSGPKWLTEKQIDWPESQLGSFI